MGHWREQCRGRVEVEDVHVHVEGLTLFPSVESEAIPYAGTVVTEVVGMCTNLDA